MSQTTDEPSTSTFGVVPADQRLVIYADYLNESKERQTVREILERDVLIALTQMNQHCIKEYPLIPAQQRAVVEFITLRGGGDNEIEEYIRKLIDNFIHCLEIYATALENNDDNEKENYRAALLNAEALLIKCIQGVCFTIAVCEDNFIEALQHLFGEFALTTSDAIIHEYAMGENYWREHMEQIVIKGVKNAFHDIRKSKTVDIRKEKHILFLTYSFDSVLERLKNTIQNFGKSEIQTNFEKSLRQPSQARLKAMHQVLEKAFNLETSVPPQFQTYISQIMCLDSCAEEYIPQDPNIDSSVETSFLELQLVSVACGAFISLNTVEQDFLRALEIVFPSAINLANQELHEFSSAALENILLHLIEICFAQLLYDCFGESRSQMHLKAIRTRRVSQEFIDKLLVANLQPDLHDKLWQADPDKPGYALFIPTAAAELKGILEQSDAKPELIAKIIRLWRQAKIKTKFQVTVRLDKLNKATTNLNHRLSLILGRFGIVPNGASASPRRHSMQKFS